MKVNRVIQIADYDGAVAHLATAFHGDGTATTLCSEAHVRHREAPAATPLCKHCKNVLAELIEAATET